MGINFIFFLIKMKSYKSYHYYPVAIPDANTGTNVFGFRFPSDGNAYRDDDPADLENLQQFYLYIGVNEVLSDINDLIRTGTDKTNKIYRPLLTQLLANYKKVCITCLELASDMCWIPTYRNDGNATNRFVHKITVDRALYEIQPAIKGVLLAVQTKMDLTFPVNLINKIARLDIERELIELKEDVGDFGTAVKRKK